MEPLMVLVVGPPNTGKTTVARIIEEALQNYGFSDIKVEDQDPSPDKEAIAIRFEKTKNRHILIKVTPTGPTGTV